MPLYVAAGKSITTRRGVVCCDDDRPEIESKDLGGNPDVAGSMEAARESTERLLASGHLIEAAESPWHAAEGDRRTAVSFRNSEAAEQLAAARAKRRSKGRRAPGDEPPAAAAPETPPADPTPEPGAPVDGAPTPEAADAPIDHVAAASAAARGAGTRGGAKRG